jgi:hypothetical protein
VFASDTAGEDEALIAAVLALPAHENADLIARGKACAGKLRYTPLYEGSGEISGLPDDAADWIYTAVLELADEASRAAWRASAERWKGEAYAAVRGANQSDAAAARLREALRVICEEEITGAEMIRIALAALEAR